MNNSTALNATNATSDVDWGIQDISDVHRIFDWMQSMVSDLLVSWDYSPEDVYFRLLVILFVVVGLYQLFVSGSSKVGSGFKWILMTVLVVILLIALGLI